MRSVIVYFPFVLVCPLANNWPNLLIAMPTRRDGTLNRAAFQKSPPSNALRTLQLELRCLVNGDWCVGWPWVISKVGCVSLRSPQIHTTYCRCRGFGPTRRQKEWPREQLHLASLHAGLQWVMPLLSSLEQSSPRTPSTPTKHDKQSYTSTNHTRRRMEGD